MNLAVMCKLFIATLVMLCTCVALLLPPEEINHPDIMKCAQNFEEKSGDCRERNLTKVPRDLNPDIQTLLLSGNKLRILRNTSFEHYPRLAELHLDSNVIDTIQIGAFFPLRDLKILILFRNPISVISDGVFQRCDNLQHLDLSQNELKVFSGGMLEFLPNLELLFLQVSKIKYVNITNCGMNRKQAILLMGNDILKLTRDTFIFTCVADSLYLDDNPIGRIDPDVIASLPVDILTLGGYPLLTEATLKNLSLGVSMSTIEEVWIKDAYITVLDENLFDALQNKALRMISLRHNNLQLYHSVFSKLDLLSALDISDCNLKIIEPEYFDGMMGLQHLYLNNNMIEVINPYNSMWKINLYHLDLSMNMFERLNRSSFSGLYNLTSLSMQLMKSEFIPVVYIDLENIISIDLSRNIVRKLKLNTPLLKVFSYGDIQERIYVPFFCKRVFQTALNVETIYLASAQLFTDDIWCIYDRFSLFGSLYKLIHLNISHNYFSCTSISRV